jgi:hypothetical protein
MLTCPVVATDKNQYWSSRFLSNANVIVVMRALDTQHRARTFFIVRMNATPTHYRPIPDLDLLYNTCTCLNNNNNTDFQSKTSYVTVVPFISINSLCL